MRSSASVTAVSILLLAGCSDGDADRVIAGSGVTTTAGDRTDLALPRCGEVPALSTQAALPALADDPEVAAWQRSRAEMGLPADEATTRAIAADSDHEEPFGFPVTPEEETALFAAEATSSATAEAIGRLFAGEVSYGGHWIDSVHRAVVVLATTDDPAEWQERADGEVGPGKVRVIQVAHSAGDLQQVREAAVARLHELGVQEPGSGDLVMQNVASVFLEVLDPALVADLASAVPSGAVCVEGAEPADVVPAGPQPQSGDGWRLLADEAGAGMPYATGFAGTASELAELWRTIGLDSPLPDIDFEHEVVVWFGPAVSSSCSDIRMDDVVFDPTAAVLSPVIVQPGGARICTKDANPHAYVVAFERDRLPGRFTVSIGAPNDECCPDGTTPVELSPSE